MGFFDIQLKNKVLKRKHTFAQTYYHIKNSPIKTLNPGYYPPYDFLDEKDSLFANDITLYLYLLENIETDNKILLDLCCGLGGGIYSYEKYLKLNKIYGIDYIEHAIQYCQNNYKGQFDVMDVNHITYPENSFDIITSIDSLQFTIRDNKNFANTIYNLLKPNGVFVIGEFELWPNDFKLLTNVFNNYKEFDITNNVHESCKDMIEKITKSDMSKEHKDYFIYSYGENVHETQHVPFKKYIFYKGNN